MSSEGVCPECTYSLTGLKTPRCPECGVELHPALLTDRTLAIPRPAWERRPRVTRIRASSQTFWDLTRHPKRFFTSMQYPDRFAPVVRWYLYVLLAASTAVWVVKFLVNYFGIFSMGVAGRALEQGVILAALTLWEARFGIAISALPMIVALLFADIILWRDRYRFRLFAKAYLYSHAVSVWFAILMVTGIFASASLDILVTGPPSYLLRRALESAWPNWVLAGMLTWQYVLIFFALGRSRFAALAPPRPRARTLLVGLTALAWALSIYLTLFDCLLGWRYATGSWGSPEW